MLPTIATGNVASAIGGGYEVANSCRFNQPDSAYMSKTHGSAGNQRTFTISFWYKRMKTGTNDIIMSTTDGGSSFLSIGFLGGGTYINKLQFYWYDGSIDYGYHSARLFRDFSAWYHVVIAVDTTQGTESNRLKIYINGVQETLTATYGAFPENHDTYFNKDNVHYIGYDHDSAGAALNGYLAELVVLDGTAANATSFGEFDEDSPTIWKPIDVSGLTFGTNGFYLSYSDSADLGADSSGNTADWTEVNLDATDQATDTPTNNFATLNPLIPSGLTYSEGNLGSARTDSGNRAGYGTFGVTAGKWYWEVKCVAAGTASAVGIGKETNMGNANAGNSQYAGSETNDIGYYTDGNINESASSIGSETSWTDGDIVSVAMDLDNDKVYFAKNDTWQNSGDPSAGSNGYSITNSSDTFFPQISHSGATDASALSNFGNPPYANSSDAADADGYGAFEYAPPTGFYALCTKNLAEYG